MENIAVLLSTYNGEKWLNEQISSILSQKNVEVTLYIRDDGSTDKTVSIIKEYKEKYSNIVLWVEENIGWGKSFMELLSRVKGHSYYCFADQDDIWLDNKLNRAIEMIKESHTNSPMLYYSAMTLIDKDGKYIKQVQDYKPWSVGKNKISASCINNLCCGCVMVFNNSLRELCVFPKDKTNIAHDTYTGAVAVIVGNVIYDKESFILHRIHSNNATVSSQKRGIIKLICHIYKSIFGKTYYNYGKFFFDNYFEYIPKEEMKVMMQLSKYKKNIVSKCYLLFSPKIIFQGNLGKRGWLGTVLLKMSILFSKY